MIFSLLQLNTFQLARQANSPNYHNNIYYYFFESRFSNRNDIVPFSYRKNFCQQRHKSIKTHRKREGKIAETVLQKLLINLMCNLKYHCIVHTDHISINWSFRVNVTPANGTKYAIAQTRWHYHRKIH